MRPPRIGILVLVCLAVATGCRRQEPDALPVWAAAPNPYVPLPGSGNAYDEYAVAAQKVEATAGKHLERVSFYPEQRKKAREACAEALREISAATRKPCQVQFAARPPFTPAPFQRGWRLIGRCFRWQAEEQAAAGEFDAAIETALTATRFGFDLTGGGATDASLGYAIVDDARLALLPHLPKMGAGQLGRLSAGLEEAVKRKPALGSVVENERQNGRLAIQALQDAAAKGNFEPFLTNLGPSVKDGIEKLDEARGKGAEELKAYFEGFARDAEEMDSRMARYAALPYAEVAREEEARKEAEKKKPRRRAWGRFAKHFLGTAQPVLEMDARTLARTRLLALTASMLQRQKLKQPFPGGLDRLPPGLSTDPFTGRALGYDVTAVEFRLYSLGADGRDDDGDTDDAFLAPDLTLEQKL